MLHVTGNRLGQWKLKEKGAGSTHSGPIFILDCIFLELGRRAPTPRSGKDLFAKGQAEVLVGYFGQGCHALELDCSSTCEARNFNLLGKDLVSLHA